jgi:4a-hydroxytetrahydrobiopterin dehydratase
MTPTIAEEEGRYPAIFTEWRWVIITLWTHKIRDLHRNDFIMAAKLDSLGSNRSRPLVQIGNPIP